ARLGHTRSVSHAFGCRDRQIHRRPAQASHLGDRRARATGGNDDPFLRGMKLRAVVCLCVAFAAGHATAAAATFPTKPVRFLVGYAPGGGADVLTRVIARKLSEAWTQPVVVENRAGAGGTIAAATVVGAPPDGYTILMITSNHVVPSN